MQRSYERNLGMISTPEVPEDKWIAGVVVVTMDEEGKFSTIFKAESLDDVPTPEVQEALDGMISQAWAMANSPGVAL